MKFIKLLIAVFIVMMMTGCDESAAPSLQASSGSVVEDAAPGADVGSIIITQSGSSAIKAITLSGTGSSNFEVSTGGAITVSSSASFDYETTASYALKAKATNGAGDSAEIDVLITVTNVVDHVPVLGSTVTKNLEGNVSVGYEVATIALAGSNDDENTTTGFSIRSGNTDEDFAIDSNGRITVAKALSHARTSSYLLSIVASNAAGESAAVEQTINILKPNVAPIADAGDDVNISRGEDINLTASGSSDSDGSIVSYEWKEGSTILGSGLNLNLATLSAGEHIITLKVTDDRGGTDTDTVTVRVSIAFMKKTGQSKSYDNDGDEVTDGSLKDDGYYEKGVAHNYTRDDLNNTVRDHVTALMWVDDAEKIIVDDWYESSSHCEDLVHSGYDDWRLPTIRELQSIFIFGSSNPYIDQRLFQNGDMGNEYWSATFDVIVGGVWSVNFDRGTVTPRGRAATESFNARCVRDAK